MIKRMINAFGREAANEKAVCVGFRSIRACQRNGGVGACEGEHAVSGDGGDKR
jgi:hypothetical protein